MTGGLANFALTDDLPVTIPRDPAREAAERELSKPIYHEHDPNLVQRAIDWFWNRVGSLLDAAAGATPGGWVGLLVVAVLVVIALIALRLHLGRIRTPGGEREAVFDTRPRTAAEHRAASEAHAARDEWDDAVRERMRAIVRGLEERALLDPRPGRTADEAANEAGRSLPDLRTRLRAAARAFDDVSYGGRHATENAYRELRELDTDLERARPRLTTTGGAPA
ncbi:DUF4129 domain-containing protein [Wenjunlia tyrosinilytica]|uniref:Membrane protein n=1 Tax=Wenjunlia tyrosinilytica TaxID=1544741 RepID=A0A917ZVC1_9ACTN|nr:DUF4129 domain-containing protein [Wenjunlia tyrosinilytica]GGO97324.1 membrane protein [Wenjunlia tyrosinilytica]